MLRQYKNKEDTHCPHLYTSFGSKEYKDNETETTFNDRDSFYWKDHPKCCDMILKLEKTLVHRVQSNGQRNWVSKKVSHLSPSHRWSLLDAELSLVKSYFLPISYN